jgi:glycogen synthase
VWGSGTGADRATWRRLQANGMQQHFSWDERIAAYEMVYRMVAPGR